MNTASRRRARVVLLVGMVVLLGGCAGALNLPDNGGSRPRAYRVHQGDTLYSIAWHYGLDYHTVAGWNGIVPPYTIYPGQRIRLYPPHRHGAGSAGRAAAQTASTAPVERYSGPNSVSSSPGGGAVTWAWPAEGHIKSTFGRQGLVGKGIVIEGKLGAPVRAAASGTVVYSGSALAGYGRLIIVKHNDAWLSAYAHNQRLLVHEGEQVQAGQRIATMGIGPGKQPGLYFEIRHDGEPVDPLRFLPKAG